MTTYAIRGGVEGARRLDLLAQVMAPTTETLLHAAGVAGGITCLDVGCGVGHVSRLLAARVGPNGRVVGLDIDAVKVATATQDCRRVGFENMDFRCTDVTTWSEPATYDVVYGRFIVSHLGKRPALIARLQESLRPGGTPHPGRHRFHRRVLLRRMPRLTATASCTPASSAIAEATPASARGCTSSASTPVSKT